MLKANLNVNKTTFTSMGVMGEYSLDIVSGISENDVMENWLVEDSEGNRMLLPYNVNEYNKTCEVIINSRFNNI